MDELKRCPCCHGEATYEAKNMHGLTSIFCKNCGLETRWGTPEVVTQLWNRRDGMEAKS